MRRTLTVIFGMLFLIWGVARIVESVQYNRACGGHLKRAADANSVEMAKEELAIAIDYLETHEMTEGYTSVLYTTPSADIGFWYKNIKASYEELCTVTDSTTSLEKSNILIKLRETLIDHGGDSGDSVTEPEGISIYPNNTLYFIWGWLSSLLCLGFGIGWLIKEA